MPRRRPFSRGRSDRAGGERAAPGNDTRRAAIRTACWWPGQLPGSPAKEARCSRTGNFGRSRPTRNERCHAPLRIARAGPGGSRFDGSGDAHAGGRKAEVVLREAGPTARPGQACRLAVRAAAGVRRAVQPGACVGAKEPFPRARRRPAAANQGATSKGTSRRLPLPLSPRARWRHRIAKPFRGETSVASPATTTRLFPAGIALQQRCRRIARLGHLQQKRGGFRPPLVTHVTCVLGIRSRPADRDARRSDP